MLAERTEYLSSGVHIGLKSCTKYLRQFVYKVRDDGLAVFNLQKVDSRIKTAADFLSRYGNIIIISKKSNAAEPITKFAEAIGCKVVTKRFSPGTLTNPSYRDFYEPDVVMVVDPLVDEQAIKEAKKKRIPVIALADTFNEVGDVDLIIPVNNNGKKSLALVFMLLAREILRNRGLVKKDSDFKYSIKDFGGDAPIVTVARAADDEQQPPEKKEKPARKKVAGTVS